MGRKMDAIVEAIQEEIEEFAESVACGDRKYAVECIRAAGKLVNEAKRNAIEWNKRIDEMEAGTK